MLNLITPLEETRFYQDIHAEGAVRGEARGKANHLKRLLARCLGGLPDWALQRISRVSSEQLDAWLDGVLDTGSLDALLKTGC